MSARKIHPLEIVLRAHGTAELVNANDQTLWASDADEDFKETNSNEFLQEDDLDDILAYLIEEGIITEKEFDEFDSGDWDMTVETLENSIDEPPFDEEDED